MKTISGSILLLFLLLRPFCHLSATNYVNNGTFTAYSLNSGDTLRIAQGNFTGVVTNLTSGAVVIVAAGAVFSPITLNFWSPVGKIINYGSSQLNSMGIGGGLVFDNYGLVTVSGDMSFFGGAQKNFYNYAGA